MPLPKKILDFVDQKKMQSTRPSWDEIVELLEVLNGEADEKTAEPAEPAEPADPEKK